MTKIEKLKARMAAHDWRGALALAAAFPRLGAHKRAIILGHEAWEHPRFYVQLGRDVEVLKADGIAALRARYGA